MLNSDWDTPHLLVLEDDATMRTVLVELLEDDGYQVTEAANGVEAVAQAGQTPFDLIIFDIRMEGIDGLETLARIYQSGSDIPSLAITGFAGDEDPVRALRLGVGDYLRKPFEPEQLLESVARLLARDRELRQTRKSLSGLRQVSAWALRVLGAPQGAAALLGRLAESVGLVPAAAIELELAGRVLAAQPEAAGHGECPARVRDWVSDTKTIQGRLLDLVQSADASGAELGEVADHLARSHPGRFDPLLLEELGRVTRGGPGPGQTRRLGLTRALLAGGQPEAARESLHSLSQGPVGPEAVEATLALAQLEAGDPNALANRVRQAVELSRQVGPLSLARAMYRGALMLHRAGLATAPSALAQARDRLQTLGLSAEVAVVELALGQSRPESVEALLRLESELELAANLDWIVPRLRELGQERLLRRLGVRYPQVGGRACAEEAAQEGPRLRVQSFGGLQVVWCGRAIPEADWRGSLPKHVFAYLASHTRPVVEDVLVEEFWPGQEKGRRRLSGVLSTIRRSLRGDSEDGFDPILRSRGRYSLNPRVELWHDMLEFEQANQAAQEHARAGRPDQAIAFWDRMVALYVAPYLEGCYLDWALLTRTRLEEQLNEALLSLAATHLENAPDRALEAAERALDLDRLQQRAHLLSLKAMLRLGQHERAIRHFQQCQDMLARELGVEPSLELLETFHRARLALP